jgi:hypothetical protein
MIGCAMVIVPGITVSGTLIAVGAGVYFAGNDFFLLR